MAGMIAIIITVLLVYGLLVYYIGRSMWRWLKPLHSRTFKIVYIVTLMVVSTSFITGRLLNENYFLNLLGAYWLALFYLLLLILPCLQLLLALSRLTRLHGPRSEKTLGALALSLLVVLIAYGSFNAYQPIVRSYEVILDKKNPVVDELNIVMVSDTHFGVLSGASHAKRMVREINQLQPDLILIPGDIIDDDLRVYLRKGIDKILLGLESKYGVYASLGNHDLNREGMRQLIDRLEDGGLHILYDEVVPVVNNSIELLGRKDKTDRERMSMSEIAALANPDKPLIMLDHQPNELGPARDNGIDLILSGHTHRGQIAPAHLITQMLFENDWGYLQKDQLHSIVSSGYGFWGPPIRLGSRSEIVQITLRFNTTP